MTKRIIILLFIAFFGVTLNAQNDEKNGGHFQLLTGFEANMYSKPSDRDFEIFHGGFGYKGNLTAIYGKVNLGYLHRELLENVNGKVQYELDYWQSFSKTKSTSIWFNYAYSDDQLFPNHRIIFEAWQKLFAGILISGGVNHYIFDAGGDATFVNIGLEKYWGRYWVEGKSYVYLKDPDITATYTLTGRIFFKDINYLQLCASMGSAQDEPFLIQSDLYRLYAYSGNVKYVTNLLKDWVRISAGFTYMYEEYQSNSWRNRYAFGTGLIINLNK